MSTELKKKQALSLFITMSVMMILSVMSVSAAAPTITWNTPSTNGTFYWQNFTLNLTTDINANCTYQVTYVNGTPAIPPTNFTTGQNTTDHTTLLDVESLPAANDYTVVVDCFDSTTSESTNDSKWFQRDPDCGDTVTNSWMLGHDMTSCSGTGLNLTGGVTFNCNSHPLSGSGGTGILIEYNNGNNNDITILNCNLSSFGNGIVILGDNIAVINSTLSSTNANGITITSPKQNILINHSTFSPTSGDAINIQETTNLTIINSIFNLSTGTIGIALQRTKNPTTITNNLFDLTADATGIELDRTNTTIIQHNNFLPATNHNNFPLSDLGSNVNVTLDNNYWGHSSCSLYSYLVDTNATTLIDHYPVSQQDNWTSYINCSDQSVFAGFASATLYDGNGSTALNMQGYDYYYDENNIEHNITDISLNGVSPWKMYTTYYYPGDQIVFDANMTPANFRFIQFGIEGNSFESYTLNVTNVTGANGSAGVYRVNISNYVFNSSNEDINGSFLPRVLNFYFRTTDDRGATRMLWIQALYNFTVQDALSSLGGDTTNWSDIPNMSNVSGLTFDLPGQGKIVFTATVDLTDPAFLSALRNLATLIALSNGTIGLDSAELAALNVSANITFYNVSGVTGLNTSTLNTTFLNSKLVVDGEICTAPTCTATNYNSTTDTFTVSVAHWTTYTIDVTPPVISGASPSGSLSSSTTSVTLQVTTDEPATCKYGTTDTDYSSLPNTFTTTGALTHQETYAVSSGNSYTFYVRCKDAVNNTNTASTTISFSVASPSTGSSGGGGGGGGYFTTSPLLTTEEKTVQIGEGGFYYFATTTGGSNYKLELTSLTETEATLSVNGQTFTLKEGDSKELDVDGNGVKDTYVELKTIGAYTITIGIRKASTTSEATGEAGTAGADTKSETTTTETTTTETTTTETTAPGTNKNAEQPAKEATTKENSSAETKTSSHWLLWTLLLIGLAIVAIVVVQRSKRTR